MLKATFREFMDDECPRSAAALAYYTIFSLPPLLVLILLVTSVFVDPANVQTAIQQQTRGAIGPEGASAIRSMIASADRPGGGLVPTLLSIAALLFGATGAFVQLQKALNQAWEVEPDKEKRGIASVLLKRVFSFGMILAIAFLLLVSLVLSAALSAFSEQLVEFLPAGFSTVALNAIDIAISLFIVTLLFAAMFKVLPDATVAWRDVWVGAFVTAVLFVAGKFLIGLYIGRSDTGSAFGAAGSLAVVLIWVYYASMVLLLGAEFTQVWARRRGGGIRPEPGAVRVGDGRRRTRVGTRWRRTERPSEEVG